MIYVDRKKVPAQLPATIDGLRTRYVFMERLHVTKSYAAPIQSRSHCMAGPEADTAAGSFDPTSLARPAPLNLN
jgi:hypothetical protein